MLSAKPIYQRLAYIESTGKQVIETGMKPNNNLTVFMDFQMIQTEYSGTTNTFCCAYYAAGHNYRPLKIINNTFQIPYMGGYTAMAQIKADKKRHTILYNDVNGNAIWDGVNKGRVYQAISPPTDAGIGVFGQIGNSGYYAGNSLVKMRLYELVGYDKVSGEEIYHAVPVLDSSGIPCLYDKISGKFEYDFAGEEAFNYAV